MLQRWNAAVDAPASSLKWQHINKVQAEIRTLERPQTHSNAERWNDKNYVNGIIRTHINNAMAKTKPSNTV
jgi:hypothetical protein